jgi:hypothetical protein
VLQHKGFPLYDNMSALMPSLGKGTHVFHPSSGAHGIEGSLPSMVASNDVNVVDWGGDGMDVDGADDDGMRVGPGVSTGAGSTTGPPSSTIGPPTLTIGPFALPMGPPMWSPCAGNISSSANVSLNRSLLGLTHIGGSISPSDAALGSKHKISMLDGTPVASLSGVSSSSKKPHAANGAVALNGIKKDFHEITMILHERVCSPHQPEPQQAIVTKAACASAATDLMQANKIYLDDDHTVALCDLFNMDQVTANTYAGIKKVSTRKAWVLKCLCTLGFPDIEE